MYKGGALTDLSTRTASGDSGTQRDAEKPALGDDLLEQIPGSDNLRREWCRVRANKGATGVDGSKRPLGIRCVVESLSCQPPRFLLSGASFYFFAPATQFMDSILRYVRFRRNGLTRAIPIIFILSGTLQEFDYFIRSQIVNN